MATRDVIDAGWSSPVARQAHNLKVAGSNPAPATNKINDLDALWGVFFCVRLQESCTGFFDLAEKRQAEPDGHS